MSRHDPSPLLPPEAERPWRLSVEDVYAMVEAGILSEEDRLELIVGEMIAMSPKNIRHEVLKNALVAFLVRRIPPSHQVWVETTVRLSADTFVEPDITVLAYQPGMSQVSADACALVIEVADASLAYDRFRKAPLYARYGIVEYWLVDARQDTITVHRDPGPAGYGSLSTHDAGSSVAPLFAPGLSVRLSEVLA